TERFPGEKGGSAASGDPFFHTSVFQRLQILIGRCQEVRPRGDAGFNEAHEGRASHGGNGKIRGRRERVLIGARAHGGGGPNNTDPAGTGGRDRSTHSGLDDLNNGNPVSRFVASTRLPENCEI